MQRLTSHTRQLVTQQQALTATRQALATTLAAIAEEVNTWSYGPVSDLALILRMWATALLANQLEAFNTEAHGKLRNAVQALVDELGTTSAERKRRRLLNHLMQTEIDRY